MTHHVVVLGAGYAGLTAARRLSRSARRNSITIINNSPIFAERVRMHQRATGQALPTQRLAEVADRIGAVVKVARVCAIDPQQKAVLLDEGEPVRYDTLVYALGSQTVDDAVPGASEYAHRLDHLDPAARLAGRLAELGTGKTVAVVGGGLTGMEAAAEIAERQPQLAVSLFSQEPAGAWLSAPARRHIDRAFGRLGVGRRDGAGIDEVVPSGVRLAGGVEAFDVVVWAAGFTVPGIARESGLAVDDDGRVLVDGHLRSISHPAIYAIGDAAAARDLGGGVSRMSCQVGVPMGWYVGGDLPRALSSKPRRPARIRYVAQHISLGRGDAAVQLTRADDTPIRLAITGRPAALIKELTVRGAAFLATGRLRGRVSQRVDSLTR